MYMEHKFIKLCGAGNLEKCKCFYAANPGINISARNEKAFYITCYHGHLHIVKWLLLVKPVINIVIDSDIAVFHATQNVRNFLCHYIPYYYPWYPFIYKQINAIEQITELWDLV